MIYTAELNLTDGEDAFDWIEGHPGAGRDDILRLPTSRSFDDTAPRGLGAANPAINLSDEEIAVISAWCAKRCIRDDRAWGGIAALYRDFSGWHGPDFAFAPSEFKAGLETIGIPVEAGFAKGLALREDLCVPVGRAA